MALRFTQIFFCGLLLWQPLSSEPKASTESEIKGRKAWVVATTMPKDVANPLPVLVGDELHEVRMYLRAMGEAIPVDATGVVRAVKPIVGEDGEIRYQDLSRSWIPEGVREALIVLVPVSGESDGLRFRSKVIDLSEFKEGGTLYVNLVKTNIGVVIGEHKALVKPGAMEFLNPLDREEQGVFPVRFFYEVPKEPNVEWKLMTSSKMAVYKSRREICIFYYNERIDNVDFRGIPFMTPPSSP